jgi:branched-chain amino acid transport system substrate-binding protein
MQLPRKLGLTLVAAALVATYGCSQKTETKSETKTTTPAPAAEETVTVKIGHAGPLTGGIAHLGKDDENGVHLAVDEANDKKIKIGGKTVKFEMMSEDDQADPKLGPTIAQKFVDAKVAGVVGHLNSGVSIPASAVYNQAGLPMISGSATNPKLTEQGFKVIFRTVGRDDQQGPAIAAYIANELKLKKVAIADDATAYGEGLANEVEKTLKAAGVQVLTREKTNDKATDFKAILTKMKGRNPDAIFYGGMDATGGPMLKQARELGIKAQFAFGDGACTAEMSKLAGDKAAEGMICSQAGIPTQMASKSFQDAFNKKYGEVKQYAPFFYDGANLLIAAMQKADSADPAKYLPELQKISYDGATGHIEFDAKGDRKDAEMTIFQMKAGKVDPVAIIKAGKTTKVDGTTAGSAPPAQAPTAASTTAPSASPTSAGAMAPAAPAGAAAPSGGAMAPAAPKAGEAPKK